jgi:hypothetical protein
MNMPLMRSTCIAAAPAANMTLQAFLLVCLAFALTEQRVLSIQTFAAAHIRAPQLFPLLTRLCGHFHWANLPVWHILWVRAQPLQVELKVLILFATTAFLAGSGSVGSFYQLVCRHTAAVLPAPCPGRSWNSP